MNDTATYRGTLTPRDLQVMAAALQSHRQALLRALYYGMPAVPAGETPSDTATVQEDLTATDTLAAQIQAIRDTVPGMDVHLAAPAELRAEGELKSMLETFARWYWFDKSAKRASTYADGAMTAKGYEVPPKYLIRPSELTRTVFRASDIRDAYQAGYEQAAQLVGLWAGYNPEEWKIWLEANRIKDGEKPGRARRTATMTD